MSPPIPGNSAEAGPNGPELPGSGLSWLDELRDYEERLRELLDVIDVHPENLDAANIDAAGRLHERMVVRIYELMRREVRAAAGERWATDDQQLFQVAYSNVADEWPAYRQGLVELKRMQKPGNSAVDALLKLREPRRRYIWMLTQFFQEFSGVLSGLFPR
jgi:hypothetical protein